MEQVVAGQLRDRSVDLEHVQHIVGFILHGCSDGERCPDRGQATVAEVADPPQRDFVNALPSPLLLGPTCWELLTMSQDKPNVFVYTIKYDLGFAPNPFHGVCSLATCKPSIRKAAEVGDIVLGKGKAPNGDRAVFVMEVDEIVTYDEYWHHPEFECKKPRCNGNPTYACGDNIYHRASDGSWVQACSYHDCDDVEHDTGQTDRVLLSQNFTYFGAEGPNLPELHDATLKQGIRNMWYRFTDRDRRELESWIGSLNGQGRMGMPADFREQGVHNGCGSNGSRCGHSGSRRRRPKC